MAQYRVKHQVFLSSTFVDLKDERGDVIQAILELDCIPAGMEAFVASSEEQWAIIKDVIAECDYYVVILAGRYGSLTPEGLSYTEKEYRFAKELGVPILAFVHRDVEAIPAKFVDNSPTAKERREAFRAEVMTSRLVREWSTAAELGGLVSRSLSQAMKRTPRPGWIRNDGGVALDHLTRINELLQENAALQKELHNKSSPGPSQDLEQGKDKYEVVGYYMLRDEEAPYADTQVDWKTHRSWDFLLRFIGPLLSHEASEEEIKSRLSELCIVDEVQNFKEIRSRVSQRAIYENIFEQILIQFRALRIIEAGVKKRAISDKARYWRLTPYGDELLVSLMAKKRQSGKRNVDGAKEQAIGSGEPHVEEADLGQIDQTESV